MLKIGLVDRTLNLALLGNKRSDTKEVQLQTSDLIHPFKFPKADDKASQKNKLTLNRNSLLTLKSVRLFPRIFRSNERFVQINSFSLSARMFLLRECIKKVRRRNRKAVTRKLILIPSFLSLLFGSRKKLLFLGFVFLTDFYDNPRTGAYR